jgi:FkbM family methyltransferase
MPSDDSIGPPRRVLGLAVWGFAGLLAVIAAQGCGREATPAPGAHPAPSSAVSPSTSPSASTGSAPRRNIVGTEKRVYSQHDEEVIIRDFFQDRRDGFYLDVGCAWPKKDNNTYYLESELGWSGIGVDALPEHAQPWKNKRRNGKFFNYIVSDRSGAVETFFRAPDLPGISSIRPRDSFSGKKVAYEEIQIPTITLTKLLDDNGVAKIDLLSMDIEGAEMPALAGFDIDRFRPELVCIEMYHAGRENVLRYFAAHGYEHLERYLPYDGVNYYFAPKPAP